MNRPGYAAAMLATIALALCTPAPLAPVALGQDSERDPDRAPAVSGAPILGHELFFLDGGKVLRSSLEDGVPTAVLEGFDAQATDGVAGLTFGRDGWLYGVQGAGAWSQVRGWRFGRAVWRWHPETDAFELVDPQDDLLGLRAELLRRLDAGELDDRDDATDLRPVEPFPAYGDTREDDRRGFLAQDPLERTWFTREVAARRVAERARRGAPEDLEAIAAVLGAAPDPQAAGWLLLALDEALRPRRDVELPRVLLDAIDAVPESDNHNPVTQVRKLRLRLRGGDSAGYAVVRGFLRYDDPRFEALRIELLDVLGELAEPTMIEPLVVLARESQHALVRRAAVEALGAYDLEVVGGRLLSFFSTSSDKHALAEVLTRRRSWALQLTQAVTEGRVGFDDVPPELVQRMRAFGDEELDLFLAGLWGDGKRSEDAFAATRARLFAAFGPDDSGGDNLELGRAHFRDRCARCHALGSYDGRFGPPLGSFPRSDRQAVIEALADPDAQLAPRYADVLLRASDGRLFSGRLVADTADAVLLEDTLGRRHRLRRGQVAALEPLAASRMPAALVDGLADGELRDLLAWIRAAE